MSELVFAYGSNMCSGRFRDYGVLPISCGRAALLTGYQLVFNKRSVKDGSGKANLTRTSDAETWGVAYVITEGDLRSLDSGEGAGYRRVRLLVRLDGSETNAWVYLAMKPSDDPILKPYCWYKRFLVEGAREHSLPNDYVRALEDIDAVEDSDGQRNREKTALLCGPQ